VLSVEACFDLNAAESAIFLTLVVKKRQHRFLCLLCLAQVDWPTRRLSPI